MTASVRVPAITHQAPLRQDPSGETTRAAFKLGLAAFGVLAAVSALQTYALRRTLDEPVALWRALGFGVASWLGWAVAVPLIVRLGARFDGRPGIRLQSLAVHLVAMLLVHIPATVILIVVGVTLFPSPEAFPWSELPRQIIAGNRMQIGILLYAAILGVGRGIDALRRLRMQELESARLEAQAARARLEALAARLQPHFLFNALHAVGALIDEEPVTARRMLVELGDLLREILAEPAVTEVSLEEELRLLARYTDIERLRFADRLRVVTEVAAPLRTARVPRFLLQPVVENALVHGIAPLARGGTVTIAAECREQTLYITVRNDGRPLDDQAHDGTGLSLTRERLQTRFGAASEVVLRQRGAEVETMLSFPFVHASA